MELTHALKLSSVHAPPEPEPSAAAGTHVRQHDVALYTGATPVAQRGGLHALALSSLQIFASTFLQLKQQSAVRVGFVPGAHAGNDEVTHEA